MSFKEEYTVLREKLNQMKDECLNKYKEDAGIEE